MRRLLGSRKGQTEGDDDDDDSGDTISWLMMVAIAVIVLLLCFFLYTGIFNSNKNSATEARCRASIATESKVVYGSAGDLDSAIACTPEQVTISTTNEGQAKRQLAETMKFCWDRWQRGQLELFKGDGLFCNPCAFVTFRGGGTSIANFPAYLATTSITPGGPTYADYLSSTQSVQAKGNVPLTSTPSLVENDALPTSVEYAVVFLYAKGASVQQLKDNFGQNPVRNVQKMAIAGGVGAAAVGAALFVIGTGGVGAVVIGVGAVALGATGGSLAEYFFGSSNKPEWISVVVLEPNTADAFTKLGCKKVQQQGPQQPEMKDV